MYVRSQRKGSRSVSSSTEALDSDQARHITQRIIQHARSLPTNSPVPYVPSTDREYRSESGLSDRYSPRAHIGKGVHRLSHDDHETRLDDYATLGGITPTPSSTGMIINPRTGIASTHGSPIQKEPMDVDRAVSSSSHHIIGEGATVFTDMTDTMLKVLDRQLAVTAQAWELENFLAENAIGQPRQNMTGYMKDTNPDWFLLVKGNPRISKVFYGYADSLSLDNNSMVLVELKEFIY